MMVLLKLGKTSSFDCKRSNVYCHLLAREYCEKSSHRRIHHILGSLIINGNYTFQKSWSRMSKKHIACDGRFAFFDNYENCIDCSSPCRGPRLKFSVQKNQLGKIEDALIMEGHPETLNLPNEGYKSGMFALVKGNWLLRVDMQEGLILDEVYIAPPPVRYKQIQWNVAEESFTLYSTTTQMLPAHRMRQVQTEMAGQEVMHLTIMSCMPLEFICQFAITRQVFGRDAVEASVFLNILMVMHSTNYVRMYSLERILETSRIPSYRLYEKCEDGSRHGVYPCPLKHNIRLKDPPPCLFEVRCRNRDVMITMPPCYYVMWPVGKANGYCCYSFQTRQIVEGGFLDAEECEFEERVSLHADDSGRIIHMKNSQLRVLKLTPGVCSNEHRLVEDFVIDFSQMPEAPVVRVSHSGRVIKPRVMENCSSLVDRVVLTMVYCDDLDMMLVVSTRDHNNTCDLDNRLVIGFYDNWNGQLLRQFVLEETASESPDSLLADTSYLKVNGILDRDYVMGFTNNEGMVIFAQFLTPALIYNFTAAASAEDYIRTIAKYIFPAGLTDPTKLALLYYQYSYPRETDDRTSIQNLLDITADVMIAVSTIQFARAVTKASNSTNIYLYLFDHFPQLVQPDGPLKGSIHGLDLTYEFDLGEIFEFQRFYALPPQPSEKNLTELLLTTISQFAKTGSPLGPAGEEPRVWPRYDPKDEHFFRISLSPKPDQHVLGKRVALWTDILLKTNTSVPSRLNRAFGNC